MSFFFERFSAFFSLADLAGFFLVSFFLSMPLLLIASQWKLIIARCECKSIRGLKKEVEGILAAVLESKRGCLRDTLGFLTAVKHAHHIYNSTSCLVILAEQEIPSM